MYNTIKDNEEIGFLSSKNSKIYTGFVELLMIQNNNNIILYYIFL